MASVQAHAAVAPPLGGVKKPFIARRGEHGLAQVVDLSLELLHAEKIGLMFGEPVEESLAHRGANAVEIERGNAKHGDNQQTRTGGWLPAERGRKPPERVAGPTITGQAGPGHGLPVVGKGGTLMRRFLPVQRGSRCGGGAGSAPTEPPSHQPPTTSQKVTHESRSFPGPDRKSVG